MPFSKLKIILERITINTWTEIDCVLWKSADRKKTFCHKLVVKLNYKQDVFCHRVTFIE